MSHAALPRARRSPAPQAARSVCLGRRRRRPPVWRHGEGPRRRRVSIRPTEGRALGLSAPFSPHTPAQRPGCLVGGASVQHGRRTTEERRVQRPSSLCSLVKSAKSVDSLGWSDPCLFGSADDATGFDGPQISQISEAHCVCGSNKGLRLVHLSVPAARRAGRGSRLRGLFGRRRAA